MRRSPSGRTLSLVASGAALCACVALLAAPRFAAAEVVSLSESHQLAAHSTVHATFNNEPYNPQSDQVVPGSTDSPVSPIVATASAGSASAGLNLTFGGPSIAGRLGSDAAFDPRVPGPPMQVSSWDVNADGTFNYAFSVTQATAYKLEGTIAATGGQLNTDFGSARLTINQDGTPIFSIDSFPGLARTIYGGGGPLPGPVTGTFLPGHTYSLTGTVESSVETSAIFFAHDSNTYIDFTLTVPEPASLALIAPAAVLLPGRRRR
jgi:hypothetical protein